METKIIIRLEIIIIAIGMLIILTILDHQSKQDKNTTDIITEDNWNGGHCADCNFRVEYEGCGTRYYYKCPKCGKTYVFNSVQNYNN